MDTRAKKLFLMFDRLLGMYKIVVRFTGHLPLA